MKIKVITDELVELGLPIGVVVVAKPVGKKWFEIIYKGEKFWLKDNGKHFEMI